MNKPVLVTLLTIFTISLTACGGSSQKIVSFQNELNTVIAEMETIHNDLNNLDVTAPDAADTALEKLNDLDGAFKELKAIEITDTDYAYITDLAAEGSDYMTQAYDLFTKAYQNDSVDEETADLAYQYLERASKRVRVIVTMLHGELPDDVIVH